MKTTTKAALAVVLAASALIAFSGLVLADGGMASSMEGGHMSSGSGNMAAHCWEKQNAQQNQLGYSGTCDCDCDQERLRLQDGTCAQDRNCLQDGSGPQYMNCGTSCPDH